MNEDNLKEKIEECFIDFSDKIKNHLVESLTYLFQNNNQLIRELFELLCEIKKNTPILLLNFLI